MWYHMGHNAMVLRSGLTEMKSPDVLFYKLPFSYSVNGPTGLSERQFINDHLCCSLSTFKVASVQCLAGYYHLVYGHKWGV